MSVCAHHTSRAWGAPPPPASHSLLRGTGFFSLVRPVRGFPSEKPGLPVSARLGAPVPAPQRRSAPVLLMLGAGGRPRSLSHPSRFVSQRTSWALHPVCFLLRLLQFHPPFPSHPSLLTTPNLPPLHVEGESFHPHFSAKANRAWGRRVGRGSRRSVPSGSPLFSHPARSVRKHTHTHTHTHTHVCAPAASSHTHAHTLTHARVRAGCSSPQTRGDRPRDSPICPPGLRAGGAPLLNRSWGGQDTWGLPESPGQSRERAQGGK